MVQRAQAFGLAAGDYERGRPGYPEAALDWLLDGSSIRRVLDGSAESIPLPDGAVDAVLAGTAWHWFDRDCAPAEIARVLRPGGVLGIVWNLRDDGDPWVATLTQILYGGSDSTSTLADEPPPDPGPLFAASQMRRFAHAALMDGHGLLALVRSRSYARGRTS